MSLDYYYKQIQKIPLLTQEEEFNLAVLVYNNQDQEAANKLISANLRLVMKIASKYKINSHQSEDLIQEGNLGLIKAVSKFNPHLGVKLSTYAAVWIKSNILAYNMNNKGPLKLATNSNQRKLFYTLNKEINKLKAQHGVADMKLVAEALDVPEHEVIEMNKRLNPGDYPKNSNLIDDSMLADEKLIKDRTIKQVRKYLKTFKTLVNDRELFILENRIMLDEPVSLVDIGKKYNISRQRVLQIEKSILLKFQKVAKNI